MTKAKDKKPKKKAPAKKPALKKVKGEKKKPVEKPEDRHSPLLTLTNPETDEVIVRIEYDGRVHLNPESPLDEVARNFWAAIARHFEPAVLARLESEAVSRARRRVQIGDSVARCAMRLLQAKPEDDEQGTQASQENLLNALNIWQSVQ